MGTKYICIVIDGKPTDIIMATPKLGTNRYNMYKELVISFIKASVCNVVRIDEIKSRLIEVTSTIGRKYSVSWNLVTLWTEEEVKNL